MVFGASGKGRILLEPAIRGDVGLRPFSRTWAHRGTGLFYVVRPAMCSSNDLVHDSLPELLRGDLCEAQTNRRFEVSLLVFQSILGLRKGSSPHTFRLKKRRLSQVALDSVRDVGAAVLTKIAVPADI